MGTTDGRSEKLDVLAEAGRFDLACACKYQHEPGRSRGDAGRWVYPAAMPNGKKVFLLKTLQTNHCVNDCAYCPFNHRQDPRRCRLEPEELAQVFMAMREANRVSGLFLSSGVDGTADGTMERMLATVQLLRRTHQFRGFIHLKVIPGCSDEAIHQAVRLASRVSVNIEAPSPERLAALSRQKRFHDHIIHAMRTIREYREALGREHCKQTTQFVVGAAGESDREIVSATHRLYTGYAIERVYYSAFQDSQEPGGRDLERFAPSATPPPAAGTTTPPAELSTSTAVAPRPGQALLFEDMPRGRDTRGDARFVREHRLYQVDYLLRRYGFTREDIVFGPDGMLSLQNDPKTIYAQRHPELFPVNVNTAERELLLRVPGLGPVGVKRLLTMRSQSRIDGVDSLHSARLGNRATAEYVTF